MKTPTRRRAAGIALTAMAGLASATLSAHHSFAMYDQSIRYVFTGVVERINPDAGHLQIFFVPLNEKRDALLRDASGKQMTWLVEMGGAAASAREGITVHSFPRGTVFSVGLVPLRNGQRGGARVEALFECPKGKSPAPGRHCDSVEGSTPHGNGKLAKPTAIWKP
jgi:Family of unknown function (DUF6152)